MFFSQIVGEITAWLFLKLTPSKIESKNSVKTRFYKIYNSDTNVSKPSEKSLPFLYFVYILHNEAG